MAHYYDSEGLQVVANDYTQLPEKAHPVTNEKESTHEGELSDPHVHVYKEVHIPHHQRGIQDNQVERDSHVLPAYSKQTFDPLQPRPWWRNRRLILILVGLFLATLAVIIALTVSLSRKSSSASVPIASNTPSADSSPHSPSTHGAFDGTGLAAIVPNTSVATSFLYYQHFNGDIRQSTLATNGSWDISQDSDTIIPAHDARNATPIAAETYQNGSDTIRHIVWLDQSNVLQDQLMINDSGKWMPGTLGMGRFRASSSPTAGLAINPNQVAGPPGGLPILGNVQVCYGGEDHRVHLLTLGANSTVWDQTYTFPPNVNGDAGFGMNQPNSYTWLFYMDSVTNELSYLYQQTFPQMEGGWQSAPFSAPVTPMRNSSISVGQFTSVAFQDVSGAIITIGVNSANPTGQWMPSQNVGNGMIGTRINTRFIEQEPPVPQVWFQSSDQSGITFVQQPPGLNGLQSVPVPVA